MLEEIKSKIEGEIESLIHELNVELPEKIEKAVELGDLSENAAYESALDRQKFVEARINHLRKRMGELSKIDPEQLPTDRAGFGSELRLRDIDTDEEVTYTIVTGDYMDIDAGHISMASPLGQALLGSEEDEEVAVELPRTERRFRVLELTTLPQMVR